MIRDVLEADIRNVPATDLFAAQAERVRYPDSAAWNNTQVEYPDVCAHTLFEQQVRRTPDAVALVFEDRTLTYRELNSRANQLAHYLRERGVGTQTLVGLSLERSREMVVALLAILKAGAAYVPLDPTWPTERLALIAANSRLEIVLTHSSLLTVVPEQIPCRLCLDQEKQALSRRSALAPAVSVTPADLAYVLHTSGSTGVPKGVQIEHRALVNFLCSMAETPGLSASDVLVAVTTISFDIAGLELLLPLLVGARVVVASREETLDPSRLAALLQRSQATALQATPATWRLLETSGWEGRPQLKALCGGEAMPRDLAQTLLARCGAVWNLYGPTETTIWSTLDAIRSAEETPCIGRPIANTRLYVLDPQRCPVPVGVAGELYIGGAGLARGYLNRPDLTAEKFVPDPFSGEAGGRLYRTGDLVKYLPDGKVGFVGRLDHQVKIRGFRIELGEIESALREHAGVREAVVVAREAGGEKRLVAYLIARESEELEPGVVREFLEERLPEYMLPSVCVWLKEMPLSPNGKVDRKALPEPETDRSDSRPGWAGATDIVEMELCRLWEETLDIRPIGITDHFRDLGGTSLSAARLFRRIQETFHRELPLSVLVQSPTIAQIAALLRRPDGGRTASSLLPIKSAGTKRPFFCVHGAGANVLEFTVLANYFEPDQPFYGLESQGLDGKTAPLTTVEEMATHYLAEIRAVQPHGPYLLGGLSFGGIVAFEMAQQLCSLGESVALLALLDTNYPQRPTWLPHHMGRFQRQIYPFVESIEQQWMDWKRLGPRQYVSARSAELRTAAKTALRGPRERNRPRMKGPMADVSPTLQKVWSANLYAERAYTPRHFPGKITLFWAQEWSLTRALGQPDCRLSWSEVAGDGLEVHVVPGDHETMRYEPHVGTMIRLLNRCLDRAHESIKERPKKPTCG